MSDSEIKFEIINDFTANIIPGKILDNNNVHEMVDIITSLQEKNYKYILVDMTTLEFISSAGVGSILGTVVTSRDNEGDIIIYGASETILHVFKVLDLLEYLTIRSDFDSVKIMCAILR